MKRILMYCVLSSFFVTGCQSTNDSMHNETESVNVVIEGQSDFPNFLVGTWMANDKSGWEIVIEPNGSISSAVHTIARERLQPAQTKTVPAKQGGEGIFEAGNWLVQYNSDNRELTVEITLDHFNIQMGSEMVEGSSLDILTGIVSKDGKQWQTEWFSDPEYFVTTGEVSRQKLPTDPNDNPKETIVFTKVENPNNQ